MLLFCTPKLLRSTKHCKLLMMAPGFEQDDDHDELLSRDPKAFIKPRRRPWNLPSITKCNNKIYISSGGNLIPWLISGILLIGIIGSYSLLRIEKSKSDFLTDVNNIVPKCEFLLSSDYLQISAVTNI